ncbi:hypothetical protein EMIHUDRAFT_243705 [Emiliania huxleyi CCMP1516]|uniref:Hexosyltransferase n=2 Tax=Emiliania huxleyi TaxID=2903 RepID=A0A0D3J512_EMIH1|nr:hypothetical protein EMIHUDRAFT_243705 [Emiliania huxleyi CCMP1516]EOD18597.1 hypothetical protein EMIHUDRAFT_243705 [Emiliania huxleyi CCMP1516]|eukprot:XP_005771026.1 hypothetical protein EMIHUDRAFT_243705 [Emiliania huxleyi CCMP1516]
MTALPTPERIMELALTTTPSEASVATPSPAARKKCDVLLLISSAAAAGYERRRRAVRRTYLTALREQQLQGTVEYRFLLGEPPTAEEGAALDAEQAEFGDLLRVCVPESYETIFAKVVAAWRWAVATHDFAFWMHADDDSYVRLDLLLGWVRSPAASPQEGVYAGYLWDGSDGRRTKPLRDPAQKSYMPVEQWPHDSYPPFASGCGHLIACDLVGKLVELSPSMSFFRGGVGAVANLRLVHIEGVRPYRPLPLFRRETLVQHYMQPEEFRQFHERAVAAAAEADGGAGPGGGAAAPESEQRIAAVYDLFVQAKVLRR